MKLRSKINLYTTVLFICLLLLISGTIYFSFNRMLLTSELDRASVGARNTIKAINQAKSTIPIGDLLRAYAPADGLLQIVMEDGQTNTAITDSKHKNLKETPAFFYQQEKHKIMKINNNLYAFISIPIIWGEHEVANLQVMESLESTGQNIRMLKVILMVVISLAAIPVFLSARVLSNFITRPITLMIQTMGEIRSSGEYKQLILPKKSKDELYLMGSTFNEMIKQLQSNYEKQEQFVENASHELKTPLTVIESYANLLKRRGKERPEVFEESVEAIHSEAMRMKDLTEQLLYLAKNETQEKMLLESISLSKVAAESIRSFQTAFGRNIELIITEEVIVQGNFQKLKQMIYILLDNAQKYSEDIITLKVSKVHQEGMIEIIDKGIGIPDEDLSKIFDRFYRVDKARTRKTGGFGLGLSLAKTIAEAMKAKLSLHSVEGEGVTAEIRLQINKSH